MNDYNIKKLYEDMEMDLIDSMKRNLSRHLTEEDEVGFKYTQWQAEKLKELKKFQRENKQIINKHVKGLNKEVAEQFQDELRQGSIYAIRQYNKLLGDNKNPSKLMNKSFFKTNDRKVKALIKSVNNDLDKANIAALRMINDEYRQIIHKSAFFVANGTITEKQATSMAIKEITEKKATMLACDEVSKTFLAGGLNCVEYANGRRVNIASYAAMAVRTASTRAHLMGEGDFRKSIGRSLVKVTTHGGACKICTKWQGKVLVDDVYSGGEPDGKHQLLSEAMKEGFLHPNCRHGITTYYPELEGISYDEDEGDEFLPDELKEQYSYYNRLGKSWNRKSHGFIDPGNRKEARSNYLACEKKKEDIIRINNMPYEDVTKKWYAEATPKNNNVTHAKYFSADNGEKYIVDNSKRHVWFDYDSKDYKETKECASLLRSIFGGKIEIQPKVDNPDAISTCDFMWTRTKDSIKEKWDLKTVEGNKSRTLDGMIKNKKRQSHNFIFDIKNHSLTEEEATKQIIHIFNDPHRDWVEKIMLKDNDRIIFIYQKK